MGEGDLDDDLGDDEGDERSVARRRKALCERFYASPEAGGLTDGARSWAEVLLRHAFEFEGVEAAGIEPDDVRDVVFQMFPTKIACDPSAADEIAAGLLRFFGFLAREAGLQDPDGCRSLLDAEGIERLRARLKEGGGNRRRAGGITVDADQNTRGTIRYGTAAR